jgi:diguanylate cyclase (GGDEF)-like protein
VEKSDGKAYTTFIDEVRVRNYLNTEWMIARGRWFVIVFLSLYINLLKPQGQPVVVLNALLALAAAYNLGVNLSLGRVGAFSIKLTFLFMYCDIIAVGTGLFFTGGVKSPFLFLWYLSLFTAGIRFGFMQSLPMQVSVAVFYLFLLFRDGSINDQEFISRLVMGLFAIIAMSMYGAIFSREEKYTHRLMSEFHRDAITDRLTGLYNYAHFIDELKKEQFRADRNGSHFSLIIYDLDFFKQVNDTYGHEKGNLLLQGVANILKTNARRMDTVARYGGEEFVILMPDSDGAEHEVAERVRKRVEEAEFAGVADKPLKITISGGVCTYPHHALSIYELLDKADKGLYTAKNTGRNKVCDCG